MGAHGRGVFVDMPLGSVAGKVLRLSPVPLLTALLPVQSAAGESKAFTGRHGSAPPLG
ncbi:MAG: universal stress protein [Desulfovibrionales bacterium]|nr:universal stress protein [Desulfovibrionales bacterium]